jgi:ParB family chromosome partitioning protein
MSASSKQLPEDPDDSDADDGVDQEKLHELEYLEIEKIQASLENPRLDFPQAELEQLSQSIARKGVLVPVVVEKRPKKGKGKGAKGKEYQLVDGERRFRCARDLGHEKIPAVVTDPQDPEATLVDMFNIHLVREEWRDMPTAWALEKVIKARAARGAGISDAELQAVTGLGGDRLKRLRYALELPKKWQEYIRNDQIPLNFFWELLVNVIHPLSKARPELLQKLGKQKVQQAFVQKRLDEVITDAVALRKVRQIIYAAKKDADENQDGESVLDSTLEQLVVDKAFTVEEAYEESVEVLVELDRLQRKCDNMVKAFDRLVERTSGAERKKVLSIGFGFIKQLRRVLK